MHYVYLHYKLIKTLCNIDSGFCTALSKQASIFPCKVYPFTFADNPFTFLKYESLLGRGLLSFMPTLNMTAQKSSVCKLQH